MISSLRTGGVGLNLTMANKCILVDPWWNEAIQDQVREPGLRYQKGGKAISKLTMDLLGVLSTVPHRTTAPCGIRPACGQRIH